MNALSPSEAFTNRQEIDAEAEAKAWADNPVADRMIKRLLRWEDEIAEMEREHLPFIGRFTNESKAIKRLLLATAETLTAATQEVRRDLESYRDSIIDGATWSLPDEVADQIRSECQTVDAALTAAGGAA